MVRQQQSKVTPHAIFGVFIALLGVVFTLDNLGLADTGSLLRFWPVLPIAVGVIMLMHADTGARVGLRHGVDGRRRPVPGAQPGLARLSSLQRFPAAAAGRGRRAR